MRPSPSLCGKVIWVTGASRGLGASLAKALAIDSGRGDGDEETVLILSSRNEAKLEEVADRIREQGINCKVVVAPCDVTSREDAYWALQVALRQAGRDGVDVLVHGAGASQRACAVETEDAVDNEIVQLCALAPASLTRIVLPRMLERGEGHIVAVCSMAGVVPSPAQASYAMAKFALRGWMSTLRAEVRTRGIHVTLLCPGPVAMSMGGGGGGGGGERDNGNEHSRSVFGAKHGERVVVPEKKGGKVSHERAMSLMVKAINWRMPEVWIAGKPVLLVAYISTLIPPLGRAVLAKIGPKRVMAAKCGEDVYANLVFEKKKGK